MINGVLNIMPQTFYTKDEYIYLNDKYSALKRLVYNINYGYGCRDGDLKRNKEYEKINKGTHKMDRWHFIPCSIDRVLDDILLVSKDCDKGHRYNNHYNMYHYNMSFVDAGCGNGWVVEVAKNLGYKAFGVEIEDKNVDAIHHLFPDLKNNIIHGDILDISYKDFDVVYFYCPIHNLELQNKFTIKVLKEVKVGSYIIHYSSDLCCSEHIDDYGAFKRLSDNVLKKVRRTKSYKPPKNVYNNR